MSTELARNRYGIVVAHDEPAYLELSWLPATSDMSDDDFKTGLMMLASEAEALAPSAILIEATRFNHDFEAFKATMAWRDENVIPRYNAAGVAKFAFLMPAGFSGPTAENGSEPRQDGPAAEFPTQWFTGRDRAVAWLTEPSV